MKNPSNGIQITRSLIIPESCIFFTASRSSGPGGQNVNKVNTRVTLWFDVQACDFLDKDQKRLVIKKLATRINRDGMLHISSRRERSQSANKRAAAERFAVLLKNALRRQKKRKKTGVPKRVKEKRLQDKKQRSRIKKSRKSVSPGLD